jgi:hypothetical protein
VGRGKQPEAALGAAQSARHAAVAARALADGYDGVGASREIQYVAGVQDGARRLRSAALTGLALRATVDRGATRTQACEAYAALLRAAEADDDAPQRTAARMRLPEGTLAPDACAPGSQAARCAAVEALAQRVATGQDVRLLCSCYPCAYHGDRIAEAVRGRARELQRRGKRRR